MAHQYRHVIPFNPDSLICNHRMFDIVLQESLEANLLAAILNSTLIALWKSFYGRFTGTEGSLDTEVIDVRFLEVPDPRNALPKLVERICVAFAQLCQRPVGRLVEEQLMECHSPEHARIIANGPLVLPDELRQPDRRALDDAVFELLGAADAEDRRELVDRLYIETASHFRKIRVVEIHKQQQRAKNSARRFTVDDLAADVWEAADLPDVRSLGQWLADDEGPQRPFAIPDGLEAYLAAASDMYDRNTVIFGKGIRAARVKCDSREQAELLTRLVALGLRESVSLPAGAHASATRLIQLEQRLAHARSVFEELAESRGGNDKTRAEVVGLLMHWFIHGRDRAAKEREHSVNAIMN